MDLYFSDGTPIRGDLLRQVIIRNDLSPVPVTLEAQLIAGEDEYNKKFDEGQIIKLPTDDEMYILKSQYIQESRTQNDRIHAGVSITAVLNACKDICFVRENAVCKESAALSVIYRACGASLKSIDADFQVPRFLCPKGSAPSFQLALAIQEEGGVVRWKDNKLQFFRLLDFANKDPVITLPDNTVMDTICGFLERHSIPSFFSLDSSGAAIFGNQTKARTSMYTPCKNQQRLRNMTRCLVRKKVLKTMLNMSLYAGDVVEIAGGDRYIIETAAHVWQSGAEGSQPQAYTKLWLCTVEE